MGVRNWRPHSLDRIQWRTAFEEAKVYQLLYSQKKKKKKKEEEKTEEEEEEGEGEEGAEGEEGEEEGE
jgi:hypothetical protein